MSKAMSNAPVHNDPVHEKTIKGNTILESVRELPIKSHYDVIVCGGGPAGIGAALAAADEGKRVLCIDRWGMLGGVWTAGLLNPFFECYGHGYIVERLVQRLKDAKGWCAWKFAHCFDVETLRRELEALFDEAGVDLLYYTWIADAIVEQTINGSVIKGVVIESKSGREAVTADIVIDATGDGDVAARAGCRYEFGREVDGLLQPMTLMYEVRGIGDYTMPAGSSELYDQMLAVIAEHELGVELPFERCNAVPYIINMPTPGSAVVQATHIYRLNTLNTSHLTRATIDARKQAKELTDVLRHIPGLEGIELVATASAIGVREGRRIVGDYYMSIEDLKSGAQFEDGVCCCAFPVDIHEPAPGLGIKHKANMRMQPYEIPLRSLIPQDVDNLLLAGRCISGSHEAHASYRVTGTAMATGQAAGLAAAMAIDAQQTTRQVDGVALRSALEERGVGFLNGARAGIKVVGS